MSILFPDIWNRAAPRVGIGRGADLVLYGLVVAFFSFTVTTYMRFREMETHYTRLARRIALDEAPRVSDLFPSAAHAPAPDSKGTDAD